MRAKSENGRNFTVKTYTGLFYKVLNNIQQGEGRHRGKSRGRFLLISIFGSTILLSVAAQVLSQSPAGDRDDLPPAVAVRLQSQINSPEIELRRSALSEIRNIETASASRIALPALRDAEPVVRATAAMSVIFLPRNEASAALLPLLADRDEFVRREAAHALGEVGDPSATGSLVRSMQSEKILEVRTAATVALGKIGDLAAVEGLAGVLKGRIREDDEFLRRSAARSIGQIAQVDRTGIRRVVTPQNFLPDKFKDLGSASTEGTGPRPEFANSVGVLITVLRNTSESDDTRREAAFSLGAIGDARAVPVLQTFRSAADPYLAEIAREALIKIERYNSSE